jgi:hypothetical protein
MQRCFAVLLLAISFAAPLRADTPPPAPSAAPASRLAVVGQLMLDFHSRAIPFESAEWWLGGRVPTANGKAPDKARPVWIQFGFKGCKPCEALATVANRELPDAEKVYIHLDNLLLGGDEYPNKPALWRALAEYGTQPPFDGFTILYGNGESLMQAMCGDQPGVPRAILVAADGRVLSILNTPTETDAVAAMALLKAP